jgi:hypothetical protein
VIFIINILALILIPLVEAAPYITENISKNTGQSIDPKVHSDYVTWEDDSAGNPEVFFKKIGRGGATTINLSNNAGISDFPQISASGNNVYVVWEDATPGNYDVFFSASTNGGASFTDAINLSNNAGRSSLPQITTLGNNVYVVWQDNSLGNYEVFFCSSFDRGSSFNNPINLSANSGSSYNQQIATSSNNVYITWQDGTFSTSDIFFRKSNDKGITFGGTINLSHNIGISQYPQIATRGYNEVLLYWLDNTRGWQNNVRGTDDIFFRKSMDAGNSFDNRVDSIIPPNVNNGASDSPTMNILPGGTTKCYPGTDLCTFIPGPTYSLVWADNTSGNWEILYTVGD